MPSKNTKILTARVKDKTYLVLNESAEYAKMTVPKLLDEIAEYIDNGTISVESEGCISFNIEVDDGIDLEGLHRLAKDEGDTVQNLLDYMVDRYRMERERSI